MTPARLAARSLVLLGAASAVGGALVLGTAFAHHAAPSPTAGSHVLDTTTDPGPIIAQPSAAPIRTTVRPRALSIPALKVNATLATLGLTSGGALDVPANPAQAGWFSGGPVPGNPGPAVVVGHVDSRTGPAVFADLRLLRVGDIVTITLTNNTGIRFQVTSIQHYPKDRFPTSTVYGGTPDPELRLITCGGPFTAHEYQDNVVVYARLAPTPSR